MFTQTRQVDIAQVLDTGEGELGLTASGIDVTIKALGPGRVEVSGRGSVVRSHPCDRCLKPVDVEIVLDFTRKYQQVTDERPAPKETYIDLNVDDDDLEPLPSAVLDIDDIIEQEILIAAPVKVLCKPDCLGLCPVCGHDLNEGDCGCDRFVPDPRMMQALDVFSEAGA